MKTLRVLAISAAVLAAGNTAFAADERVVTDEGMGTSSPLLFNAPSYLSPFSFRAEGGTTGYGGAVVYDANPSTSLVVGYNGGEVSWSDDLSVNGTKYDLEQDNNNPYINIEYRPFTGASWMHVAFGVGYNDNEYKIKASDVNGGLKLDNQSYADLTTLRGDVTYKNSISPYIGVGINPQLTKNIGLFGQIGAYYTGNPTVNLVANAGASAATKAEVEKEERKIAQNDRFQFLPVAKVGLSLRF
jgi:hypothetical protein